MGSGDWFKTIIRKRKAKQDRSKQGSSIDQSNGSKWKHQSNKLSLKQDNGSCRGNNPKGFGLTSEEIAAIRIQTAFRGFQARKILRKLKRAQKLQFLTEGSSGGSVKRQTSSTLQSVLSWTKIQAEIRARRFCMVSEGRIKQKRNENQLKLEAKLHDLEVEWCGGAETMDEILARVHQREEAAVKRERAMAYAFSHQWRANPSMNQVQSYEFGRGNWGWSWIDKWIAARPWEMRIYSLQKAQSKAASKTIKNVNTSTTAVKPPNLNIRISAKKNCTRLADEKAVNRERNSAVASTQTSEAA